MQELKIAHALVVMIGIGKYPNGGLALGDLPGVVTDYVNMINTFVKIMNFRFLYLTDDDKTVYLNKKNFEDNYRDNFKLFWTAEDINQFVENVRVYVNGGKQVWSGLIFIISSHGDREDVLIHSELDEYSLPSIFSKFWNINTGCTRIADKPKLFLLDMCKGAETANSN